MLCFNYNTNKLRLLPEALAAQLGSDTGPAN